MSPCRLLGRALCHARTLGPRRRDLHLTAATVLVTLALPAAALAHPELSPAVSLSGRLQLYSLAVPTEKPGAKTDKVVLTVPSGFGIDSFAPAPAGWHRQVRQTGAGDNAVVTQVTWSGGATPTGEDSLFAFLAEPTRPGHYAFTLQQTYTDGSIVNWTGSESSDSPAPTITAVSAIGGQSSSTLTIVALIVGGLGLAAGALALVMGFGRGSHRPLV
ncbi:MAG TPA: DUF1775 domain-containing protein [Solirubrobacteraceae bacterium]|nr:DUF1775 domain-containing protein [Solirubrobacteraceae bacterium]